MNRIDSDPHEERPFMNRRLLFTYTVFFLFLLFSVSGFADPKAKLVVNSKDSATAQAASTDSDKININTASASELQKLKGVGKKRAEQIIKDRETNGPFSSPQDLTRIKGIGPKTVEKNLAIITTQVKPDPKVKAQEDNVEEKK